eukprot:scaffold123649_cov16-Tisochrysis_lutea.AAC.2
MTTEQSMCITAQVDRVLPALGVNRHIQAGMLLLGDASRQHKAILVDCNGLVCTVHVATNSDRISCLDSSLQGPSL